jgi:hypothetical protein
MDEFMAAANEAIDKQDYTVAGVNLQLVQIELLKNIDDKLGRILFHERWS